MATNQSAAATACGPMEADLVLYYYGDLDFDAKTTVETHLGSCQACREYLEELRSFLPQTVAGDEPPDSFWAGYRREMRQKLDDAAPTQRWWERLAALFQPWPVPAIATVAVVGLALAVTFSGGLRPDPEPPKENQAMMELLPVAENLEFFTNMDVLDSMDLLEDLGGQANGTS